MKLSKKYKPKSYKKTHFNSVADGTFPIFLPNTSAFDQEALASLQYQELMIRNLYQFTGKQYHPCYFTGLETSSYQDKMQGKKSLPYFAKMQRLEQLSSKQNKKSERWIHQLFSDLEAKRVDFDARLYAQMQSVFDLFKGHQLLTQAPRLVYRDVSTQSVVNEDDIEWRKEEQYVLEIKCFVETKNEVLPLFVTDLLSFFSDVGVVVHTNDKRYKKHIGKNIIIPIINKSIPIFGEEGIDTIKENGILRINPLLSETSLRKTQHYGLNIEEDFIDEQGCFYPGLQHFSGQSIFEFEENIVETLDTIGNLASKKKQLLSVPYSKHTGQRLIKKVLPLWYLDTSSLQAWRKVWLEQYYPNLAQQERLTQPLHLPLESVGAFLPKLMIDTQQLSFGFLQLPSSKPLATFEWMLGYLRWGGYLGEQIRLDDLIDTIYLVPERFWEQAVAILDTTVQQSTLDTLQHLKNLPAEQLVATLISECQQLSWIERNEAQQELKLGLPSFLDTQCYSIGIFDEGFLRVVAVIAYAQQSGHHQLLFAPYNKNFLATLLLLLYLEDRKEGISFIAELPALKYQHPISEKSETLAKNYGRDTLRLLWAKQLPQEDKHLIHNFEYLQHFRNLFKLLYERWAFSNPSEQSHEILPLDLRIYSQWEELWEQYLEYQKTWKGLWTLILQLQEFSKGQYTWYLEFLKKDIKKASNQVATTIFLEILQILSPMLPNLKHEIEQLIGSPLLPQHHQKYGGKKDYKVHLLFDMIKGIHQKKQEIWLKKHHPLSLAIKANSEILKLVQENQVVFDALLRTQELLAIPANEQLPAGFASFMILDIEIGIQAYQEQGVQDELPLWEKQYQDKLQQLEYIRSTLMMLSSNPLIPREKLEAKEQEMYALKEELDLLDIKIKKLKIQRKSAS